MKAELSAKEAVTCCSCCSVCVCVRARAVTRMLPEDKGGFFLLPLDGKCAPATQQACPGLWFWNVGELPPRRPAVGGRCWWARPSPQTWLVHTLCFCPRNQANTLHTASMGAEWLNRCPEPLYFPRKRKCWWPRGGKDSDSSRHLWLQGGRDRLKLLLAQGRAWILCLPGGDTFPWPV